MELEIHGQGQRAHCQRPFVPLGVSSSSAPILTALATWSNSPLHTPSRYAVTQAELFALLCRLADELLFRQIAWIKKLPFFCELSIKDYTCLLSSTWQELILLSSLTVYSKQIFGELADVTAKYSPSDEELHRWELLAGEGVSGNQTIVISARQGAWHSTGWALKPPGGGHESSLRCWLTCNFGQISHPQVLNS